MPEEQAGASNRLQQAIDDLREAAESATGDVRARIDDALDQIREVSSSATSRAQESATAATDRAQAAAGDVRMQLETFRDWIQGATADVLDQIQAEVDRRRRQLRGGE